MNYERDRRGAGARNLVQGVVMVLLGLVFFAAQFFEIDLGRYTWPLLVVVPGLVLVVLGLVMRGASGEPLVILGSMAIVTGLILSYQNATDLYATWAYAWALVTPTAIGLGKIIYGAVTMRSSTVREGTRMTAIGLAIFLVAGAFFEGVIGLSGFGIQSLGGYIFPVLLIGLGVILLFTNLLGNRREPAGATRSHTAPHETRPEPTEPVAVVEPAHRYEETEPWPPATDTIEEPPLVVEEREGDDKLEIHKRPE